MEKDSLDQKQDGSNLNFKRKASKEVLEISSTGYGYESVYKETEEEKTSKKTENKNPFCGGL